jgi:hypothetical protein
VILQPHATQSSQRDPRYCILLVLDARDPAGGAVADWEEEEIRAPKARSAGRQPAEGKVSRVFDAQQNRRKPHSLPPSYLGIIDIRPYYCNVDLVPHENAQVWLKHLRHTTPTLSFRFAGPHQRANLASGIAPPPQGLKAYTPSAAQSITVAVVCFPNVGERVKQSDQHG